MKKQTFKNIMKTIKQLFNYCSLLDLRAIKFIIVICLLAFSSHIACAQKKPIEIKNDNLLTLDFQFIGKSGETKKYLIDLKDVPGRKGIPNEFKIIENQIYNIKTQVIPYGNTILTFVVPVNNQEDFKRLRVLQLTPNELNPDGLDWTNCTVVSEDIQKAFGIRDTRDIRKEGNAKFLPNYTEKKISCAAQVFGSDGYFAVVAQNQPAPTMPFTDIEIKAEKVDPKASPNNERVYKVTFKNIGNKDVGEINFYSNFNADTEVKSVNLTQGSCNASKNFGGIPVCHLGKLSRGDTITVEFTTQDSYARRDTLELGKEANSGWRIEAIIKENPNDSIWSANFFVLEPFADTTK